MHSELYFLSSFCVLFLLLCYHHHLVVLFNPNKETRNPSKLTQLYCCLIHWYCVFLFTIIYSHFLDWLWIVFLMVYYQIPVNFFQENVFPIYNDHIIFICFDLYHLNWYIFFLTSFITSILLRCRHNSTLYIFVYLLISPSFIH